MAELVEVFVQLFGVQRTTVGVGVGGGVGGILGGFFLVGKEAGAGAVKVDVAGLAIDEEAEAGGDGGDGNGASAENQEIASAGGLRELLRSRTARYWSSARPFSSRAASLRTERAERVVTSWS